VKDGEPKIQQPTPERLAKAGDNVDRVVTEEDGRVFMLTRLTDGSPLEQLASLGQKSPKKGITGLQYYAGSRYYQDAYDAGVHASGVPDLSKERVDGGGKRGVPDRQLAAAQRYAMALKAVDQLSVHVLWAVVLRERPLAEYADRYASFPQARERRAIALQRLRDALDQLGAHYDKIDGNTPRQSATIEVSHLDDYRPDMKRRAE
jgi:hypothetical protein